MSLDRDALRITVDKCAELREALEAMLDLITSGRHYQTQNPYSRPEVEQAYRALGRDWRTE